MKEPSLDAVLECLGDIGYCYEDEGGTGDVLDSFFGKRKNVDSELAQLLFFCRKEQASTFENALGQIRDDEEKRRIVSALVTMYPITGNVVLEMLKKADITPAQYLEIVDFDNALLKGIRESLDKVMQNSTASNVKANRYLQELKKLEEEIKDLRSKRDEMIAYNEKLRERTKLQKEIHEIEETGDRIDEELDALKKEKERLEKQKKEKEKEIKKLHKDISDVYKCLQSPNDKNVDEKYKNALKSLEACMKALSARR